MRGEQPNVKRRPLALIAAAAFCLSSCSLLVRGTYPGDLAQARAQVNLSADVAADHATEFSLAVVKQGGFDFVLLFSPSPFSSSSPHLLVLTPDLTVVGRYSLDALAALPPAGYGFKGSAAVARHVDGTVIVGNVEMSVVAGALVAQRKIALPSEGVAMQGSTIVGPATASFTWSNFSAYNGTLTWDAYESDWSGVAHLSAPIGSSSVEVEGVYANPEADTVNTAWIAFRQWSSTKAPSTTTFVRVPMDGGLSTALAGGDILTNTAYTSFTVSGVASGSLAMTSDSIVAMDESTKEWIRFTPDAPTNMQRISEGSRDPSLRTAFSFSGSYYCVWDPRTETLTTYDKWW